MDQPLVFATATLGDEGWEDPNRGSLRWRTIFSGDRTPTSGLTVGIAELVADGTVGNPHHRHVQPEFYYILDGQGIVEIDGVQSEVAPGSAVFIPSNSEHALWNTGTSALRLLYSFAADSFADVAYVFSSDSRTVPIQELS